MFVTSLKYHLTISIVLYKTNIVELDAVLNLISESSLHTKVFLFDNSPTDELKIISKKHDVDYIFNNGNVGYGTGHNIVAKKAEELNAEYHLVMNSDVEFDPEILKKAFQCMEDNPEIGLLSPEIRLRSGELQHFCRLLPNPFDLFARRFIPAFLKQLLKKPLDRYVLTHKDYSKSMNIPNLPGCFMFIRMRQFKLVNGFDENFFLYVEDIDLTRRLHHVSQTVYFPEIKVAHGLARGSYKFSKLVFYHIKSAIYYFNKWGWFFDKDRGLVNNQILQANPYVKIHKFAKLHVSYNGVLETEIKSLTVLNR